MGRLTGPSPPPTWGQGWRSGESTRLPPIWPGFDSPIRRLMWAEFVGSLSCSERFFSGYSGFPLSPKTNISPTRPHKLTALNCIPYINKVSLPFLLFTFYPMLKKNLTLGLLSAFYCCAFDWLATLQLNKRTNLDLRQ